MAASKVIKEALEYAMHHRPSAIEGANTLSHLDDVFPSDIYSSKARQYYGTYTSPKVDNEALAAIHAARGDAERLVDIYRAVPKGVRDINTGDWVTTSKTYAKEHGKSNLGDFDVIGGKARAGSISMPGDSIAEQGYWGDPIQAKKIRAMLAALGLGTGGLALGSTEAEASPPKAAQKAIQEALSAFSGTAAEKQGLESFISSLKHSDLPTGWQDNPAIVDAAAKMYQQGGTESPFFKAWFGNSKVVDKKKNPLPVYHGTNDEFNVFSHGFSDKDNQRYGPGFYFSEDKGTAGDYGIDTIEAYLSHKKPVSVPWSDTIEGSLGINYSTIPKIIEKNKGMFKGNSNPVYDYVDQGGALSKKDFAEAAGSSGVKSINEIGESFFNDDVENTLKAISSVSKKDSAYVPHEGYHISWFPEQIKSTSNRGTFDPSDPNILKGIGIGAAGLGALTAPSLATASTMQKVNKLGQFDQFAKDMPATNDIPTAMRMAQQYSQRSGIDPDAAYKVLQALGRITPEKGLEEPVWSPIDMASAPIGAVGALGKGAAMALDAPVTYAMDAGIEGLMKLLRGKNESSLY